MAHVIIFDAELYLKKSRRTIPYWDQTYVDKPFEDGSLHWFHVAYGRMELYRVYLVDSDYSIAEPMDRVICTSDEKFGYYSQYPERAITDLRPVKCTVLCA